MSDHSLRVNQPSLSNFSVRALSHGQQAGALDGIKLSVHVIEDDVDELIETDYRRQNFGLDAARPQLQLSQMKLEANDKPQEFSPGLIKQYLKSIGNNKSSSELTQNLLKQLTIGNPIALNGKSQQEIAEFAIALHRLYAALNGSDDEFVAWLSPLKPETPDLAELAKKLQDAGGDAKQMQDLLSDFRGLPEDEGDISNQFGPASFDVNLLRSELWKAQRLPKLGHELKRELAEKVKDELQEIHRQFGTHLLALRNLLEKAGDLANVDLAESYDQLIHGNSSGITSTMEILATRHSEKELLGTVIPVIEKTLSHELSLDEEQRSVEKEKLYAILSEIQQMNILKALIERLGNFASSLGRLYGISTV